MNFHKDQQYICMNPNCQKFGLKIFKSIQVINHNNCSGWILKIDDLKKYLALIDLDQINLTKKNAFDFKLDSIKSLFEIQTLFNFGNNSKKNILESQQKSQQRDPISLLKFNFNQIRIKIETQLERIYYQIESRVLKVKQVQEKTIRQIKRILSSNNQFLSFQKISKSVQLKAFGDFCEVADMFTIIQQQKITKQILKIFESIQSIGNSFWNTELDSIKRQKIQMQKAQKQLQNFHNDQTIHPAVKLQNLQTMFQAKQADPQYSQDKSEIWLKCWICGKNLFGQSSNKKLRKIQAYTNLTNHVTQQHFKETSARFFQQTMKSATHKLTYTQFIYQIQQKRYDQFIIIDRQNMNKSILSVLSERINQKTLVLDVVSTPNQNLAIGKYLISPSHGKDSSDIFIVMMIYAIITSGYYRFSWNFNEQKKPKIVLATKDHFAQTFQQILKNQFTIELQIIN